MSKNVTAQELGIDLVEGKDGALFKWLLASFLMGKRIQAHIAEQAYRVIVDRQQCDSPRKLAACTHRQLVRMLGEAGYARYDESTATRLLALAARLNDDYGGKVRGIRDASADRAAFEKRLQDFDGIGPKTTEIFMREAGAVLY